LGIDVVRAALLVWGEASAHHYDGEIMCVHKYVS
jgi:hypothetical protein